MRIKTFEALDIAAAIAAVKKEMGPDAVILSTREVRKENGLFGLFSPPTAEVVAATDLSAQETATLLKPAPLLSPPSRPISSHPLQDINHADPNLSLPFKGRLGGDGKSFDRLFREISGEHGVSPKQEKPSLVALYEKAIENGLDRDTAEHLFDLVRKKLEWDAPPTEAFLKEYIRKIISEWVIKFANPAQVTLENPIIALVGPTGVGKTTTLVKIAATLRQAKKKVTLATLDTYRVGAVEQLRTYSQILGIPARVISSADALIDLCEETQKKSRMKSNAGEFLLIDTAGRSPFNDAQMEQLKMLAYASIQVHLVLSAGTRESDLDDIIDHFSAVPINRLLFTKLDETKRHGHLFGVIRKRGIKPSYFTMGQRVPEDMESATPEKIAEWVLP
jgi:flagellar biosynthesis protein FlhF